MRTAAAPHRAHCERLERFHFPFAIPSPLALCQESTYTEESHRLETLTAQNGRRMETDRLRFVENEREVRQLVDVLDLMLSGVIARPIPPRLPSPPTAEELDRRLPLR